MKQIITSFIILFTSLCFAQNTGIIVGKILDKEFNNNPLVLATVSVKGTLIALTTDQTGLFVIENLKDGDYTLLCSFIGYKTEEIKVKVASRTSKNIKISLGADTLSLTEIELLSGLTQKEDKKITTLK